MIQLSLNFPDSFIIICPWCHDCWARIEGLNQTHFWHRFVSCLHHPQSNHAYYIRVAGSLLEADEELIDFLPPEVLLREFQLTMSSIAYE